MSEFRFLADQAASIGVRMPPVTRVSTPTDDGLVSGLRWGDAAPAVTLLHGAGLNAHAWDVTLLHLGRPALALDLPGHGDSAWRTDLDYTPEASGATIASALPPLVDAPRPLVGHSLGGLVAAVVAATHPELVTSLLLVESLPFSNASFAGPNPVKDFMAGPRVYPSRQAIVDRALALGFGPTPADVARSVELNTTVLADGTVTWKYHLGTLEGVTVFDSDFSATWSAFDALTVPTTLVYGTHGLIDDDLLAQFRQRMPDAQVIALDAGHNIHEEQPERLAEIIGALHD